MPDSHQSDITEPGLKPISRESSIRVHHTPRLGDGVLFLGWSFFADRGYGMCKEDDGNPSGVHLRRIQPDRSTSLLKSLSNPARVKLLYGLAQGTEPREMMESLGLTVAELDYHLRALHTYGLVTRKADGFALTSRGIWLVEFLEQVSEKLTTGRDTRTPLHCWQCGGAEVWATVYPDHFKLWCPSCGGTENDRRFLITGQNLAAMSWTEGDPKELIFEGVRLEVAVLRRMLERGDCRECGGPLMIVRSGDRVKATCPFCGEQFQGPVGKELDDLVQKMVHARS